jgi:uncharacterized membrane protein YwzB
MNGSLFDAQKILQLRGPLTRIADGDRSGMRLWVFIAVALGGIVTAFLLPPLRQPQSYHHFADGRTLARIPNCLNVISSAGFLIVGVMGLRFLARPNHFIEPRERVPYVVFFAGVLLTCFGSGYYHGSPRDATLVWDRLPMTLAFMALLAATVDERISVNAGSRLLWPLTAAGAASVWWWQWTGNLWPYMAAQYFSILLIALLLLLFRPRYTRSSDLLLAAAWYVLAKVAEGLDARIYAANGWISGHTLKHLLAAVAVYWVLRMLRLRSPLAAMARVASSSRPRLEVY